MSESAASERWHHTRQAVRPDAWRHQLYRNGEPASVREVLQALSHDPALWRALEDAIAQAPSVALRFETPPLTRASADRPFEFVLVDAPELERPANPADFAAHFRSDRNVVDFPNLGGDAHLIVPCPPPADDACFYTHLASFLRGADDGPRRALWRAISRLTLERISNTPLWLNTAGDGVPWLHVRLDSSPKYYRFALYRT